MIAQWVGTEYVFLHSARPHNKQEVRPLNFSSKPPKAERKDPNTTQWQTATFLKWCFIPQKKTKPHFWNAWRNANGIRSSFVSRRWLVFIFFSEIRSHGPNGKFSLCRLCFWIHLTRVPRLASHLYFLVFPIPSTKDCVIISKFVVFWLYLVCEFQPMVWLCQRNSVTYEHCYL